MKQGRLNKKVLVYFRHRLKYYNYCSIDFIRSEELRAASENNLRLAEAIRQALIEIEIEEMDNRQENC